MINCAQTKKDIALLNRITGISWVEVPTSSYASATTCVVTLTPDNLLTFKGVDGSKITYYQPSQSYQFSSPEFILKLFVNSNLKDQIERIIPTLKVDLQPESCQIKLNPVLFGKFIIECTLKLDGDLKARRINSLNKSSVSLNNLKSFSVNARVNLEDYISSFGWNINLSTGNLTIYNSLSNSHWALGISFSRNTFCVKCSPQEVYMQKNGWIIAGQIGFEAVGSIFPNTHNMAPAKPSYPIMHDFHSSSCVLFAIIGTLLSGAIILA